MIQDSILPHFGLHLLYLIIAILPVVQLTDNLKKSRPFFSPGNYMLAWLDGNIPAIFCQESHRNTINPKC
jgi:hypothetical protein